MTRDEPAASAELFGMTDLEDALWGPDGQAVRADVVGRLAALAEIMQNRVAAGLSPQDFASANTISIALAAAHKFMLSARGNNRNVEDFGGMRDGERN